MKKILYLIPSLEGGGAERQLVYLANELIHQNYKVYIACRRINTIKYSVASKIKIYCIGDYTGVNPFLLYNIYKLINDIRPDIVQTWLRQMDILVGILSIFKRSYLWVISERTSPAATKKNTPVIFFIRKFLSFHAKSIICNSVAGKEFWDNYVRSDSKVKYIPNAVNFTAIIESLPSPSIGEFTFIATGRLSSEKNHLSIIKAFSLLPKSSSAKLIIIGSGELESKIKEEIENYNLNKKVTLLPFNSDWWGSLMNAAALINLSLFEGMPNVALEAAAAKCPLILSDIAGHRDIFSNNSAIYVKANDSKHLSRIISTFDRTKFDEMTFNALKATKSYNIKNVATKYIKIYDSIR